VNVLVTGGAGFLGQPVLAELKARGHDGYTYDRRDGRDILDPVMLATFLDGQDAVIHLAGLLGTHELFDRVQDAIDVNVGGTAAVLEACHKAGARYVSTTMPSVFPSVYTATKLGAVALERAFHHTYGLRVSRVRAFNAYGPGQKHGPGHPQKILPTFAAKAWAGEPIPISGDGTQTVDLIHVNDLARMLVDALEHGDDATFDGGTGVPVTVSEVAEVVLDITGSKAGIRYLPMRRGEVATRIAATGQGWDRLDWRPVLDWNEVANTVISYRALVPA
jgi:UDP-glucose 4-epimerase